MGGNWPKATKQQFETKFFYTQGLLIEIVLQPICCLKDCKRDFEILNWEGRKRSKVAKMVKFFKLDQKIQNQNILSTFFLVTLY